jgi:glutamate racemase
MVLRAEERKKPIGIFDSGLGGLTVLKAIIQSLPGEDTIYLGDTARVPYGTRSAETIIRYSLQNTDFLVRQGIKLLVVACNTSSAAALTELTAQYDIPVVGVIEPGARAAVRQSGTGRIGIIGTRGTIDSGAYERAIKAEAPSAEIFPRPCPLFVSLAEEGWVDNQVARLTAGIYLSPLLEAGIDTLLLGCTHYPLLREVLGEVAGPGVTLIDSARETAGEVRRLMTESGLNREGEGEGDRQFFVTDLPDHFWDVGHRFLGERLEEVSQVDLNDTVVEHGRGI